MTITEGIQVKLSIAINDAMNALKKAENQVQKVFSPNAVQKSQTEATRIIANETQKQNNIIKNALSSINNKVSETYKGMGGTIADTFGSIKTTTIAAFTAIVGAAMWMKSQVATALSFDREMSMVWTLLDKTKAQMKGVSESVKQMAVATGTSIAESAKGLYWTISAGVNELAGFTDQTRNAVAKSISEIATATGGDTTSTTRAIMGVVNAYGKALGDTLEEQVKRASDIMFQTTFLGITSVPELANSLGYINNIAAQTGVAFEEVGSALAVLTRSGLGTDNAVTALKATLSEILKPSEQASELAKRLGIDFSIAGLKAKGYAKFMTDMLEKTGGKAEYITVLFNNVRSLTEVLGKTENNQRFLEFLKEMEKSAGSTEKAMSKLRQSISFKEKQLDVRFEVASERIGMVLVPVWQSLKSLAASFMEIIASVVEKVGTLVEKLLESSGIFEQMTRIGSNFVVVTDTILNGFNFLAEKINGIKGISTAIEIAWKSISIIVLAPLKAFANMVELTTMLVKNLVNTAKKLTDIKGIWESVKNVGTTLNPMRLFSGSEKKSGSMSDDIDAELAKMNAVAVDFSELNKQIANQKIEAEKEVALKLREIQFQKEQDELKNLDKLAYYIEKDFKRRTDIIKKQLSEQEKIYEKAQNKIQQIEEKMASQKESFEERKARIISAPLSQEGKDIQQRGMADSYLIKAEQAMKKGGFEDAARLAQKAQDIYGTLAERQDNKFSGYDFKEFLSIQEKITAAQEAEKKANQDVMANASKKITDIKKEFSNLFLDLQKKLTIDVSTDQATMKLAELRTKFGELRKDAASILGETTAEPSFMAKTAKPNMADDIDAELAKMNSVTIDWAELEASKNPTLNVPAMKNNMEEKKKSENIENKKIMENTKGTYDILREIKNLIDSKSKQNQQFKTKSFQQNVSGQFVVTETN